MTLVGHGHGKLTQTAITKLTMYYGSASAQVTRMLCYLAMDVAEQVKDVYVRLGHPELGHPELGHPELLHRCV